MSRLQVLVAITASPKNSFHVDFLVVQSYSDLVSILESLS